MLSTGLHLTSEFTPYRTIEGILAKYSDSCVFQRKREAYFSACEGRALFV